MSGHALERIFQSCFEIRVTLVVVESSPASTAAELEIPNCQPRYTTLAIPDKAVGSYCTPRQILAEKKLSTKNLLALNSPYGAHFVASARFYTVF